LIKTIKRINLEFDKDPEMNKNLGFNSTDFPFIRLPKGLEEILSKKAYIENERPVWPDIPEVMINESKWIFIFSTPIIIVLFLIGKVALFTSLIIISVLFILWVVQTFFDKRDYAKRLTEYNVGVLEAQIQENNYQNELIAKSKEDYLRNYHQELFKSFLKTVKKPNIALGARKGKNEKGFGYSLNFWFNDRIFVDYAFSSPPEIRPFIPDFIYQDENNLHLDIEIDEPYSLKTKEPLHYIFDELYIDNSRDSFFANKKGWIVVRFAEIQIVEQPNECCKVIAYIINEITGNDSYLKKLVQYQFPKPVQRWTKDEALERGRTSGGVSLMSWNGYLGARLNQKIRSSRWNNNIQLEVCDNPYTDYGLLRLSPESIRALDKNFDEEYD
jgi:very-short-patch-repair endonuclease